MLSILFNKSVQTDPVLIHDFSRIAILISNKLNGGSSTACTIPKHIDLAMAERKYMKQDESHSSCSRSNLRLVVPNDLPKSSKQRKENKKQSEESIVNTVSLVQCNNFMVGLPLWQPRHMYNNYNLIYGNINQAVLQPHLSQNYFHRPNQESQRRVQTITHNGGDSFINQLRFWEQISPQNKNSGFVFSVMCYNVLAQDLLDQHPYLYTFHDKKSLKWNIRWNNILGEIRRFNPDILCMQEVQGSHLETYFSTLEKLGYRGLYKQRTGPRTDGCSIYYKYDVVNLIEYTTVEYNQPNVRILDRDNVAIVAKFSPKNHPQKEFVVATTHLLYNPRRQDVRLAQTQLLLAEVDRIAFIPRLEYLPIIITGDLNSSPDSAVYKLITKGKLRYDNLSLKSLENKIDGPKTGKKFLPATLQITDHCQHAGLLSKRENNAQISRSEELELIQLKNSERSCDETKKKDRIDNDKNLFASGTLSHNLSLHSVYEHRVNGGVEGTTFQDEWVSVDYIFYSKRRGTHDLKLLERYRLPINTELGNMKIPNSVLGSDHLALLAKFQLTV